MSKPEMHEEMNHLVRSIAKILKLKPERVAKAFETGEAEVKFTFDDDGRRAIGVRIDGRGARVALDQMEDPTAPQETEQDGQPDEPAS